MERKRQLLSISVSKLKRYLVLTIFHLGDIGARRQTRWIHNNPSYSMRSSKLLSRLWGAKGAPPININSHCSFDQHSKT